MRLCTVKLQYRTVVQADSKEHAFRVMECNLRSTPGLFIAEVVEGGETPKRKPLRQQFVFGY